MCWCQVSAEDRRTVKKCLPSPRIWLFSMFLTCFDLLRIKASFIVVSHGLSLFYLLFIFLIKTIESLIHALKNKYASSRLAYWAMINNKKAFPEIFYVTENIFYSLASSLFYRLLLCIFSSLLGGRTAGRSRNVYRLLEFDYLVCF